MAPGISTATESRGQNKVRTIGRMRHVIPRNRTSAPQSITPQFQKQRHRLQTGLQTESSPSQLRLTLILGVRNKVISNQTNWFYWCVPHAPWETPGALSEAGKRRQGGLTQIKLNRSQLFQFLEYLLRTESQQLQVRAHPFLQSSQAEMSSHIGQESQRNCCGQDEKSVVKNQPLDD